MPSGKKKKRHKMSTHKRKKRLRKNRHKSKSNFSLKDKIKNKLVKQKMSRGFVLCLSSKLNHLKANYCDKRTRCRRTAQRGIHCTA